MVTGGFLQMDPEGVEPIMRTLSDNGRQLGTAWRASQTTITGNEPAIGSDLLGQAFRGIYQAGSTAAQEAAAVIPESIMADAEVGNQCCADYIAADQRSCHAFRSTRAR